LELLQTTEFRLPAESALYGISCRPVRREAREEIDVWHEKLEVGSRLPKLSLFLGGDLSVMVDFEESYRETCQRLKLRV
jgi:hypothetical protein